MINSKTIVLFSLVLLLFISSCSTSSKPSNWRRVEEISPVSSEAITPNGFTSSPILDIETLKIIEGIDSQSAKSITKLQEERKEEITLQIQSGEKIVDQSLSEEEYGDKTSGTIAKTAEEDSFVFLPNRSAYSNSIAEYDYSEGLIYEVVTSPGSVTDIRLQPGETLSGSPIMNNGTSQWQFASGVSVEDGERVEHIFIRPLITGLDTTIILLTNMRTYYLRAASFESSHMVAVRWRYPNAQNSDTSWNTTLSSTYSPDIIGADYSYSINATKNISWAPSAVFSNNGKTYIQFPPSMKDSDIIPSVYVKKKGTESLVNFRIKGGGLIYELDVVIDDTQEILLKSGQKESVKIKRRKT